MKLRYFLQMNLLLHRYVKVVSWLKVNFNLWRISSVNFWNIMTSMLIKVSAIKYNKNKLSQCTQVKIKSLVTSCITALLFWELSSYLICCSIPLTELLSHKKAFEIKSFLPGDSYSLFLFKASNICKFIHMFW